MKDGAENLCTHTIPLRAVAVENELVRWGETGCRGMK